jgi:MFS transporter, UMF1 family
MQTPMPLLERLGLHTRQIRAWAFYEWATTGMWAVIVAAVFPIYYRSVLAVELAGPIAVRNFAFATTLGILLIGLTAPILGAITDRAAIKKPLLASFAALGISGCALLFFVDQGQWQLGLAFFVLVNLGANGSIVFYAALLPHVARPHEMDRVSTGAFALGYLGAGLLLAFSLLMIQAPHLFGLPAGTLPVRLSFLAVAVWWAVFSIPLFRHVPEPVPEFEPGEKVHQGTLRFALHRIVNTFRELRSYRNAFILLVAYLIYGDGIGTIIRMATVYGTEIGIGQAHLIGAIVLVQFVGVPFSFLFGMLAGRIGTRPALFVGLAVYTGVTVLAFFMTAPVHFWALATLVGMVQGGTQALTRSLFASLIPAYKSGELFGFYGSMDKFAGMMGPTVMGFVAAATGSTRFGILSVLVFFIVGALVLALVDVDEGRRVAREAQERARPLPAAREVAAP